VCAEFGYAGLALQHVYSWSWWDMANSRTLKLLDPF